MNSKDRSITKFLLIAAASNLFLASFKLIGGILGESEALISDAIHSLADVLSTIIVMIGILFSKRKIDSSHTYGHERMECVASILLSILLFFTGISIGKKALTSIFTGSYKEIETPNILALIAAILSIIFKEIMFWATLYFHKKTKLISLKADAWHQRIDALSSVGSLLGIVGSMAGYLICDVLASLIICLFIIKIAADIFIEACNRMVDKSCDAALENKIKEEILLCDGVLSINEFRSRLFGAKIIIEIEIVMQKSLILSEACELAENIENVLKNKFSEIKKCSVLITPSI